MPRFAIGIDLGGTNLRVAAYTEAGSALGGVTLPTRSHLGPQRVLDDMADAARGLRVEHTAAGEFAGIGIGSPGPIQLPEGRLVDPANLPGFHGLALREELHRRTGERVLVESDANAATYAEWRLGTGVAYGIDSMAMFTLGTGVGGGLVLHGKIWHGSLGMAGEPGHTVAYPGGVACNCGTRGCAEGYASATAVRRMAVERGLGSLAAHEVAELAGTGNALAMGIYSDVGRALGLILAAWIATLNLPLYVLGGGMCEAWDLFAPAMLEQTAEASQIYRMTRPANPENFERGKTNILRASLGASAGILGAALLPFGDNPRD